MCSTLIEYSSSSNSPDDILDTQSSRLRLGFQPYLSLLDLDYAVDGLPHRGKEARVRRFAWRSNAVESAPKAAKRRKRIRPPKHEKVYVAVHRHNNMLYYKRLDPEAFVILGALSCGVTVEDVCAEAIIYDIIYIRNQSSQEVRISLESLHQSRPDSAP
jgi:hypothetical protein